MGLLNLVTKPIALGIGVTSEAIAANKKSKFDTQNQSVAADGYTGNSRGQGGYDDYDSKDDDEDGEDGEESRDNDHAEWALDDAQTELQGAPPAYSLMAEDGPPAETEDVARAFLTKHPLALNYKARPLPCPVILPQRRPKNKSRGFVRAYAPVLGEYSGIDQQTFLDFLEDFDQASKASPVFEVINLAAFAVGMIPNPISMGVAIGVQVAAITAQRVQSLHRTNTFLDRINESLFMPRGLYCMIMTFQPDMPYDAVMTANVGAVDAALCTSLSVPDGKYRQTLRSLKASSGTSHGELSIPESAPLIYPALDVAIASTAPVHETTKSKLQAQSKFLTTYLDRRAQAAYAGSHPTSQLNMPPPPNQTSFASRYSDPNHPANSGTILALLTGGAFDPYAGRRERRAQKKAGRRGIVLSEQDMHNVRMGQRPWKKPKKTLLSRVLTQNVFYLAIVNLPSEEERKRDVELFGGIDMPVEGRREDAGGSWDENWQGNGKENEAGYGYGYEKGIKQ